jgi:predicted nucleotidyltransferase
MIKHGAVVDADELKRQVAAYFADERNLPDLAAVYLFGSVARGSARADSDVDVGILYRKTPAATFANQAFDVAADLSEKLGRTADVVIMNGAPVDLVKRVLRDGHIVVERDRGARIAFEVRARNEYFDLLPILRLYRRRPVTP